MSQKGITISELRRKLTNELSANFSTGEAGSLTGLILEHLGYSRSDILKDPSATVNSKIQAETSRIMKELEKGRPIQYILGQTEFSGLSFTVDENVLIPRPETEEMVELIRKEELPSGVRILDIGTGSGCIAVSLAKHIAGSKVTAMETDPAATALAKENARLNQVQLSFIQVSLFEYRTETLFDLIVSNPPYVTRADKKKMDPNVTEHEPDLALYVPDSDPLIFYREIRRLAGEALAENGIIWLEINEAFGRETGELFLEKGYENVKILKDIHGKNRFIRIQ